VQTLLATNSACEVALGADVSLGEDVVDGLFKGLLDTFIVGDVVATEEFIGLGSVMTARAVKLSVDSIANALVARYPKKNAINVTGSKTCAALTLIRARK
jgi:hypothetical protein